MKLIISREDLDAVRERALHRYHVDPEFHAIVDNAVNASLATMVVVDYDNARLAATKAAGMALMLAEF